MRKTLYSVGQDAATQSTITVTPTIVDPSKSDLTFTAVMGYVNKAAAAVVATICKPDGAIKVYRSMDDMLKDVVNTVPSTNTVTLSPSVVPLQRAIPLNTTANSLLLREKASLTRNITKQGEIIAEANATITSIAAYATGSAAQIAFYQEQVDRRTVATASKTAMDARLVAINALL